MPCTHELAQLYTAGESSGCCKTSSLLSWKSPYQTFPPAPSMGQHHEPWLTAAGSRRELSTLEQDEESRGARGISSGVDRAPAILRHPCKRGQPARSRASVNPATSTATAPVMGSTDQPHLTDGRTEQTALALKENELFPPLPREGNGFYPFSRIPSKRLFLSVKKFLFSDPAAEIKGGSVMYKNKKDMQTPSKLETKLPAHDSQSLQPTGCSPAASSLLCFTTCFLLREQVTGRQDLHEDKSPGG